MAAGDPDLPIAGAEQRTHQFASITGRDGVTFSVVAEADHRVAPSSSEKAKRREARAAVEAYHQEQLRALLEHVREAFARLDAGGIDEFQLDDLIHRTSGPRSISGSSVSRAAGSRCMLLPR